MHTTHGIPFENGMETDQSEDNQGRLPQALLGSAKSVAVTGGQTSGFLLVSWQFQHTWTVRLPSRTKALSSLVVAVPMSSESVAMLGVFQLSSCCDSCCCC